MVTFQRYVLTEAVDITGLDFLGRNAAVRLEPSGKPGWYIRAGGRDVLIAAQHLHYRFRRVVLCGGSLPAHFMLQVVEHLLALRWFVDEVRIVPRTSWLPYGDSSALIFWQELTKAGRMRPDGHLTGVTIHGVHSEGQRKKLRDPVLYVAGVASGSDSVVIDVKIDYPIGVDSYRLKLPTSTAGAEEIIRARAPGWPRWWYGAATVFQHTIGWPHRDSISWPDRHRPDLTLREWARHRALDVLGTFGAALRPETMLIVNILSDCAGHRPDVAVLKRMADCPQRVVT
jgi:UDP-3-O-acyl-N-acetylglucosamine deacetylase